MDTNQLLLTTDQLAQAFGTTPKVISNNFNRHKNEFIQGTHYFLLEGDDLKVFLSERSTSFEVPPERSTSFANDNLSGANSEILSERNTEFEDLSERSTKKIWHLYLWTVKGAFEHAWILKSAHAKQAYEKIVDQAMQGAPVVGLLEENTNLRQQAQMYLDIAAQSLRVDGPDMENAYETGEIEALAGSVRQLMKEMQAILKAKKIDADQLLELARRLEKKMAVLEERAAKTDETMMETLSRVGDQEKALKEFYTQAQAMLPPARQIEGPKGAN